MTPDERLEELRSELPMYVWSKITEDMECAQTCETLEDFRANLKEAMASCDTLRDELKMVLVMAGGTP